MTTVEVTYPPGGFSTPHSHPCPVIGYVLKVQWACRFSPPLRVSRGENLLEEGIFLLRAIGSNDKGYEEKLLRCTLDISHNHFTALHHRQKRAEDPYGEVSPW